MHLAGSVKGKQELPGAGPNPGEFRYPLDVEVDLSGNVLVVDQYNHRIQKFDGLGTVFLE